MTQLQRELEDVLRLVTHCRDIPQGSIARMNFIVNLVTILEVHSRQLFHWDFTDSLLEGSYTTNSILRTTVDSGLKTIIREMTEIRNDFVHEGKSTSIGEEQINRYYIMAKAI